MNNAAQAIDKFLSRIIRGSGPSNEPAFAEGRYIVKHIRNGKVLSEETFNNVVANEGKNYMLDSLNNSQTAVGPYMGLIKTGTPTVSSTMATPIFTETTSGEIAARQTGTWNAAGTPTPGHKQLTSAITFTAVSSVTVTGAFIVFGTGAVSTAGSTAGKLWSAGLFGSSKALSASDQLQVSYDTNL